MRGSAGPHISARSVEHSWAHTGKVHVDWAWAVTTDGEAPVDDGGPDEDELVARRVTG